MFIKKGRAIASVLSAGVLSVVFGLLSQGVAHAVTFTCSWTGGSGTDTNFSTATNWTSCGGGAPTTNDNLVFDNSSAPTGGFNLNDDIAGADYNNITFSGTGSTGYDIAESSANTFTFHGNLTDSTTDPNAGAQIDMPVTIGGNSTVSTTEGIIFGDDTNSYHLNIGTNNVVFSGNGLIANFEDIIGSGTATISMGTNSGIFQEHVNPSFTGAVDVSSGVLELDSVDVTFPDFFNAASSLQVASGASLYLYDPVATTGTLVEPITAGGTGDGQCTFTIDGNSSDCGSIFVDFADGSNLTLSGAITLTSNTEFNSDGTITITGPLSGSFTVTNIDGELVVSSSSNTSGTANGTYGAPSGSGSGSGGSSGSGSSGKSNAPKDPNTGIGLTSTHVGLPLIGVSAAAGGIYLVSRKAKRLAARK